MLEAVLQDWLDKLGEEPGLSEERLEELLQVWAASDFSAQTCLRHPRLLLRLDASGELDRPYTAGEMQARLDQSLQAAVDEAALYRVLRAFRREQMLRIIWRDITRKADLAETLEDLSELADCSIRLALDWLMRAAVEKHGQPRSRDGQPQELVVLGMGKLGARELNLSSDIDLIFCFPEQGQTDGRKPLDNEQFFTRVGRGLINALGKITEDGFVFRVDMRLRPFGEVGALVSSFSALETYYETQAREWERYAMIKARPITGEAVYQQQLLEVLRPFVYRRYIDFGVIAAIRDMKRMIQAEMHKKGMDRNIKLGRGGIREIEFIGQALQLVHGGRDKDLQIRPILPVLELLRQKGLLPEEVVDELHAAYVFLRLSENRIQAWKDEQTHLLPEDELGRQRLARSMGEADWTAYKKKLDAHRDKVQTAFAALFGSAQEADEEQHWTRLWLQPDTEQAGWLAALVELQESAAFRALPAPTRDKLDHLMPEVLRLVAGQEDPATTLSRILRILGAVFKRSIYLDLLLENPQALEQLVKLAAASKWIVRQLLRYPVLLDELLDPRRLYSPLLHDELRQELQTLLARIADDDLEQQMERLRQFAAGNRLRVAAADITGAIPLMVVSDYLTAIAEVVLEQVLELAWKHLASRYGTPGGVTGSGLLVVGYGKLGGWELGYGSDLDLVLLRQNFAPNAMTRGHKSVPNEVFYMRLAQRMVHLLNTRTPSGILYKVDMRLRPNGNSGLLVTSMQGFEDYQRDQAWVWEQQALVRARAVVGDPALQQKFTSLRQTILAKPRDPQRLAEEVAGMREKMRQSLDKSSDSRFDIKQGKGGITDIEFMVQYLVLRWAWTHPKLTRWTDNIRLLDELANCGVLSPGRAEQLAAAYRDYRGAYHRCALQEQDGQMAAQAFQEQRVAVQAAWRDIVENP